MVLMERRKLPHKLPYPLEQNIKSLKNINGCFKIISTSVDIRRSDSLTPCHQDWKVVEEHIPKTGVCGFIYAELNMRSSYEHFSLTMGGGGRRNVYYKSVNFFVDHAGSGLPLHYDGEVRFCQNFFLDNSIVRVDEWSRHRLETDWSFIRHTYKSVNNDLLWKIELKLHPSWFPPNLQRSYTLSVIWLCKAARAAAVDVIDPVFDM